MVNICMKTLREMIDIIESASLPKDLVEKYSELYYLSHEGYSTDGQDAEEYFTKIIDQMEDIEQHVAAKYGSLALKQLKIRADNDYNGKVDLDETQTDAVRRVEELFADK